MKLTQRFLSVTAIAVLVLFAVALFSALPVGAQSDMFRFITKNGSYYIQNLTPFDQLQTDTAVITTGISSYKNFPTVAAGIPVQVAKLDLPQQSANLINQALYAVPSTGAGFYRATCYIVVVQAATTSGTMPACQLIATDADTVTGWNNTFTPTSTTNTVGLTNSANVAASSNAIPNTITFYAGANTQIQISTNGYASVGGFPLKFTIHVRLEYLGT